MSEKLEALLQAVIDAETDTAYCNASESLAEAAPQILALIKARTPAPEGEAVAWRARYKPGGPAALWTAHAADPRPSWPPAVVADYDCQPLYASPVVPVGRGEAWPADDPRYEIDVTYEVWQGDSMVAGSSDLAEAQRYAALYEPCSLLRATTYRQPAHLLYASPVVPVGRE